MHIALVSNIAARQINAIRYAASAPGISTLEANAPRLCKGNVADYWRFPTLGDLDTFVDWYKAL